MIFIAVAVTVVIIIIIVAIFIYLRSSPSNSCSNGTPCPQGQTCSNGTCVTPVTPCGPTGMSCPTGQVCSNGYCITPPTTDPFTTNGSTLYLYDLEYLDVQDACLSPTAPGVTNFNKPGFYAVGPSVTPFQWSVNIPQGQSQFFLTHVDEASGIGISIQSAHNGVLAAPASTDLNFPQYTIAGQVLSYYTRFRVENRPGVNNVYLYATNQYTHGHIVRKASDGVSYYAIGDIKDAITFTWTAQPL